MMTFSLRIQTFHSDNWFSLVEVINEFDQDQIFFVEQPHTVENYQASNFIEVQNFTEIQTDVTH